MIFRHIGIGIVKTKRHQRTALLAILIAVFSFGSMATEPQASNRTLQGAFAEGAVTMSNRSSEAVHIRLSFTGGGGRWLNSTKTLPVAILHRCCR